MAPRPFTKVYVLIKTTVLISCVGATLLLSSCRVFRPAASGDAGAASNRAVQPNNHINTPTGGGSRRVYKVPHGASAETATTITPDPGYLLLNGNIENSSPLQFKYAVELNVMVEALNNVQLLNYIDDWWGTRYRYGGNSKSGVDCSAFAGGLISNVYLITVPRTVHEQYQNCQHIEDADLQEGDLVFFNTKGPLSHVGVYLANNKFVHASVSSGVMISDLAEPYFLKRYAGAGRVR